MHSYLQRKDIVEKHVLNNNDYVYEILAIFLSVKVNLYEYVVKPLYRKLKNYMSLPPQLPISKDL